MIKLIFNAFNICLRPLLGPPGCCRFELSCTDFARMELQDKPFLKAVWSICKRVLVCNPLIRFMCHSQKS